MSLSPAQQATLKAAILADPALAPLTSGPGTDLNSVMLAMNAAATPAFVVWRTSVTRAEYQDDDNFDWTVVDNLSTGSKYRIWEWMLGTTGSINPSKPKIRAGIAACWVGNAALVAVQTAVLQRSKRSATRVEKLFATGTGTDATPAVMVFEGSVSINEIAELFP
jgi:hypothetical protein